MEESIKWFTIEQNYTLIINVFSIEKMIRYNNNINSLALCNIDNNCVS